MLPLTNPHASFSGMENKSDGELLQIVAGEPDNPRADAAFRVFYNRHIDYVFFICKSKYGKQLCDAEIVDLVQETFVRVYEKAATFREDATLQEREQRKRTHLWLQRIMEHILIDRYRRHQSVPTQPLSEQMEDIPSNEEEGETVESDEMRLIKQALEMLPERDREVLRTVFLWYEPNKKLPSHVIADLVERYQTTPENIRKIVSRAKKRIREFIEQHKKK